MSHPPLSPTLSANGSEQNTHQGPSANGGVPPERPQQQIKGPPGGVGATGAALRITPDMETAGKMLDSITPVAAKLAGGAEPLVAFGGDLNIRATGINIFFSTLAGYSSETAASLRAELERRAEMLSFERELAAAKQLAQAEYDREMSRWNAFIEKHGKPADELSDKEINAIYNTEYFVGRLRELGYFREQYSKDVTQRNALIRAQSAFNIPITAKFDLETKRALIEDSDYLPQDVITGEHPEGRWIVINKSSRILTVYDGDKTYAKYPVALGKRMDLTPTGQFTFVSKYVNPRWGGGGYAEPVAGGSPSNPLGKRWMGLSVGGGGRYGVHGNASANSIGTYASNGCIRMINADVEEMYEYIPLKTPVWIGSSSKLDEWGIHQLLGGKEPVMPDYLDYLPGRYFHDE